MIRSFYSCWIVLLIASWGYSQQSFTDSLKTELTKTKEDSSKVILLNQLVIAFEFENPALSKQYVNESLTLAKKINYSKGIARCYTLMGYLEEDIGNYDEAFSMYKQSLEVANNSGDKLGAAVAYNNMGVICSNQGNYPRALENYFKALKIMEEIKDERGIAHAYYNIGNVYNRQENYEEAVENYSAALEIKKKIGDEEGIANVYVSIGSVSIEEKEYTKALKYLNEALKMYEKQGNTMGIAIAYDNIGLVYNAQGKYEDALKVFLHTLEINTKSGDKEGLASDFTNLGTIYMYLKKYEPAQNYLHKGIELSTVIQNKELISNGYKSLSELYDIKGNYKEASEFYKKHILYRDSLINEENTKKTVQEQMNYEFEKKETATKAEHEKQIALSEAEKKRQQLLSLLIGAAALAVAIIAIIVFRSLTITKKQKLIIEEQKKLVEIKNHQVEEKQKEIIDSIQYAKRIQSAILTRQEIIQKHLPESFVLFKPKDIVSGDFYWLETSAKVVKKEERIFFAVADCTGHGVPGAMVSVMCSNALTKVVKELNVSQPAGILDKTVEVLEEQLSRSHEELKDGMDISLCSLDIKNQLLEFAGANNPLYIIQNGELKEIKADKQPIGKYADRKPFTNYTFHVNKGDCVYVFSDGFADQFGGPNGKKFKYKPFKDLLLANYQKPMEEQKKLLDDAIEKWKNDLEQVDDICVMGVRV